MRRAPQTSTLIACLSLAACGEPQAALSVDGVSYSQEQLLGLSSESEALLAGITAVVLAIARDEASRLGAPLLEERRRQALVGKLAEHVIVEAYGADDQVLEAHYLTNPEYELTIRHIVFLSEGWQGDDLRQAARRKAEAALGRARSGEPFAKLAAELSEEPGADRRGGRLEPGREGSWVPEFWAAARSLQEGEISDVVESQYGFHVIKLEKRDTVAFEEARDEVVAQVAKLVGSDEAWREWADSAVQAHGGDGDRLRVLSEAARSGGLALSEGEETRIRREWDERVRRWAITLGFLPDAPTLSELPDRALEALAGTGQNARLARDEIREVLPALLEAYEIRGLETGSDAGAEGPGG